MPTMNLAPFDPEFGMSHEASKIVVLNDIEFAMILYVVLLSIYAGFAGLITALLANLPIVKTVFLMVSPVSLAGFALTVVMALISRSCTKKRKESH